MAVTAIAVRTEADVGHARREVQQLAVRIGFGVQAAGALELAVTELATNLVQHGAVEGQIELSALDSDRGAGIEIVSSDRGPGIADPQLAVRDHFSTKGTSGCGLGAVRRLMDEFEIRSTPLAESGTCPDAVPADRGPRIGTLLTARKWLRDLCPLARFDYSVTSRPVPGEAVNGDAFLVQEDGRGLLVAVIDGLGHGPEAAGASEAAVAYIRENQTEQDLVPLVVGLHEALRGTRGAAATLLRICLVGRRLFHTAVGNVDSRVYPKALTSLVMRPGVLGTGGLLRPRVNEAPWSRHSTLVVYSDGLSAKWDLTETPDLLQENVTAIGHHLMRNHARANDDATVVVAREVPMS